MTSGTLRDGRLYIDSRARDMILRGAENIYPVEIEHRLEEHPQVAEAAVIGADHPELWPGGQGDRRPRERVRPDPDPADLAAWVGERLAPYKVPAHWEIRPEPLPRNAAGRRAEDPCSAGRRQRAHPSRSDGSPRRATRLRELQAVDQRVPELARIDHLVDAHPRGHAPRRLGLLAREPDALGVVELRRAAAARARASPRASRRGTRR